MSTVLTYSTERFRPQVPACAKAQISLHFDGTLLRASGTRRPLVLPAVSGKRNEQGHFELSSERQALAFQGPIPEGEYWVQPSEMWENNWFKSLVRTPRSSWGHYRLAIHPYPTTTTHGRGGFFLHGGAVPSSAGCIDLTLHMDDFVEQLTNELQGWPECFIPLSVRYR